MRNYLLVVAAVGLSSTLAVAQQSAPPGREFMPPEVSSLYKSMVKDSAWSSVYSAADAATGVEGAAWTSYMSLISALSTADPSRVNAIFSTIDIIYTLVPTAYQTKQASFQSQLSSIYATYTGSAPSSATISSPPVTTSSTIGGSVTTPSASGNATQAATTATSTGGVAQMTAVGYAVAVGAIGVAAALL